MKPLWANIFGTLIAIPLVIAGALFATAIAVMHR